MNKQIEPKWNRILLLCNIETCDFYTIGENFMNHLWKKVEMKGNKTYKKSLFLWLDLIIFFFAKCLFGKANTENLF